MLCSKCCFKGSMHSCKLDLSEEDSDLRQFDGYGCYLSQSEILKFYERLRVVYKDAYVLNKAHKDGKV